MPINKPIPDSVIRFWQKVYKAVKSRLNDLKIKTNIENGNHSLVLLDIKADNPDENPRYMTASQAAEQMIEAGIEKNTMVAAAARVGREDQKLWYGKLKYLVNKDLGKEPHSIVVPSKLHFTEQDFLESL